jgi:probable HAF family extracellular repeat protein
MALHSTTVRHSTRLCRFAITLGALIAGPVAHAAPTYHLIDLGPNTKAVDINHNGHVAGWYDRLGNKVGVWRDGAWQKTLHADKARAKGIGPQDLIAADLRTLADYDRAGAILPDGQVVDIDAMLGPDTSSSSEAVTSDGTIVGTYHSMEGAYSFSYRDNVVTTLPCPDEYVSCLAYAASPTKGWIAGIAPRKDAEPWFIAAMLFDGTSWKDLGTLGGWSADVHGVNRKGHVVGASTVRPDNHRTHAFIHTGKFMKDLKTLGGRNSYAYAINSKDVVVGRSEVPDEMDSAFYWDGSGPMVDLNTLLDKPNRLHLVDAVAINEDGWIAANAVYFDTYHGVLLKPVSR